MQILCHPSIGYISVPLVEHGRNPIMVCAGTAIMAQMETARPTNSDGATLTHDRVGHIMMRTMIYRLPLRGHMLR